MWLVQSGATEAMKQLCDEAMRWSNAMKDCDEAINEAMWWNVKCFIASIFASIKSFIAALLKFFALITVLSLHSLPNLPSLP
jgi:hypothetical protein